MSMIQLIWSNIKHRRLSSLLTVILFTFGIGLILLMTQLDSQVEDSFKKNIKGIDLVIGAKGSPLQLILASVYHSDFPTGNVKVSQLKKWYAHPQVKEGIPMSYGDGYMGYRMVGTEKTYLDHYEAKLKEGRYWKDHMEVVVGSIVASELGLKIGDEFASQHGLDENAHAHNKILYKVVGVLEPNHSIIDQIILSDIPSVWLVHDSEPVGKKFDHWTNYDDMSLTAMLLKFKSRYTAMMTVRRINEGSSIQAALPIFELDRMMQLIGDASDVMKILSIIILAISALGIFISLFNKLEERKRDIALIRVMGGSRAFVFKMILGEGVLVAIVSYCFGLIVSKILLIYVNQMNEKSIYQFDLFKFDIFELYILALAILIGTIAALIPAMKVYKMQITNTIKHD